MDGQKRNQVTENSTTQRAKWMQGAWENLLFMFSIIIKPSAFLAQNRQHKEDCKVKAMCH